MAIDKELLMEKAVRSIGTGLGVLGSSSVGDFISNNSSLGNVGVGLGQFAVGHGVALATEQDMVSGLLGSRRRKGMILDGVEHVGHGVAGAGFAEAGETFRTQTSQQADEVVRVEADASRSSGNQSEEVTERPFSADVA